MRHTDSQPVAGAARNLAEASTADPDKTVRVRPARATFLPETIVSDAQWAGFAERFDLTAQELQCTRLMFAGSTTAKLVGTLGISRAKTRRCQAAVREKLGISSDKQLVVRVLTECLLRDPGQRGHAAAPEWDRASRELRFAGVVVKKFGKPAPNQELLLDAFQLQHWIRRIDDPLPLVDNLVPSVRLHETIHNLNRTLQQPLIKFGGDGTGRGVCWSPAPCPQAPES